MNKPADDLPFGNRADIAFTAFRKKAFESAGQTMEYQQSKDVL